MPSTPGQAAPHREGGAHRTHGASRKGRRPAMPRGKRSGGGRKEVGREPIHIYMPLSEFFLFPKKSLRKGIG